MNEITTLFTAIGDFFTKNDWYQMVKWPFWILLFTVAAGGVYTARFGKKNLVCQGVAGMLNLVVLYLAYASVAHIPFFQNLPELPFLSFTDKDVSIVDPFGLNLSILPLDILRLMLLIFLLHAMENFNMTKKNIFSWFFHQCIFTFIAVGGYMLFVAGVQECIPARFARFAIIPVVLIVLVGLIVLALKFIYTFIITDPSTFFTGIHKFFTVNRGGSLFTTSAVTFLLSMVVMILLDALECAKLTFATANYTGLRIIIVLCLIVQYIFSMLFNDKKK